MIRVVIADDHHIVRQGIEALLSSADDIELVSSASNGDEAVEVVTTVRPDVVLMDINMGSTSGIEATKAIHKIDPNIAVVALTAHREEHRVLASLDAGMIGYVVKDALPEEILRAVRDAAVGASFLDGVAARALVNARAKSQIMLTDRERQVLDLIEQGMTNRQIADRLGIAEKTVKAHLTRVYATIGVSDRAGAAAWARNRPGNGA